MSTEQKHDLILASKSSARRDMLAKAGLAFEIKPSNVDETAIMKKMTADRFYAPGIALELAKEKALDVAAKNDGALVIGADQTLEFDGVLMAKAKTDKEACQKLKSMRDDTHTLTSAVCVAKGNNILWTHIDDAALTMKNLDDDFMDWYCAHAGDALTRTVGAYELEGLGSWLFSSVKGDFFTILGMPLLPLLAYLYNHHDVKPEK